MRDFVLNSKLNPKDNISISIGEDELQMDDLLSDFRKLKDITSFFNSFLNEIAKNLEAAQQPNLDFHQISELCVFVSEISMEVT